MGWVKGPPRRLRPQQVERVGIQNLPGPEGGGGDGMSRVRGEPAAEEGAEPRASTQMQAHRLSLNILKLCIKLTTC